MRGLRARFHFHTGLPDSVPGPHGRHQPRPKRDIRRFVEAFTAESPPAAHPSLVSGPDPLDLAAIVARFLPPSRPPRTTRPRLPPTLPDPTQGLFTLTPGARPCSLQSRRPPSNWTVPQPRRFHGRASWRKTAGEPDNPGSCGLSWPYIPDFAGLNVHEPPPYTRQHFWTPGGTQCRTSADSWLQERPSASSWAPLDNTPTPHHPATISRSMRPTVLPSAQPQADSQPPRCAPPATTRGPPDAHRPCTAPRAAAPSPWPQTQAPIRGELGPERGIKDLETNSVSPRFPKVFLILNFLKVLMFARTVSGPNLSEINKTFLKHVRKTNYDLKSQNVNCNQKETDHTHKPSQTHSATRAHFIVFVFVFVCVKFVGLCVWFVFPSCVWLVCVGVCGLSAGARCVSRDVTLHRLSAYYETR